jgi:hypothetical protein
LRRLFKRRHLDHISLRPRRSASGRSAQSWGATLATPPGPAEGIARASSKVHRRCRQDRTALQSCSIGTGGRICLGDRAGPTFVQRATPRWVDQALDGVGIRQSVSSPCGASRCRSPQHWLFSNATVLGLMLQAHVRQATIIDDESSNLTLGQLGDIRSALFQAVQARDAKHRPHQAAPGWKGRAQSIRWKFRCAVRGVNPSSQVGALST